MKTLIRKINTTPFPLLLVFLIAFLLPYQKKYHTWLKSLSKIAFDHSLLPPFFIDRRLNYFSCDALLLGLLAVAVFICRKRKYQLADDKVFFLSLVFFGICLLSIFISPMSNAIWPYYSLLQMALPLLALLSLSRLFDSKRLIEGIFWIFFWSSLFQIGLTFAQYILQHSLGFKELGEIPMHPKNAASFWMISRERWVFDALLGIKTSDYFILRPAGTLAHTNLLGGFFIFAVFGSGYLFMTRKSAWMRLLIGTGIFFQCYSLALTFSRAALAGLTIGCAFFLITIWIGRADRKRILQLGSVLFISALCIGVTLKDQYIQRGGITQRVEKPLVGDQARKIYKNLSWQVVKERPLTGCGWGQYLLAIDDKVSNDPNFHLQRVHNIYWLIFSETGVFGLIAFLGILGATAFRLIKGGISSLMGASLATLFGICLWIGCVDHYWLTLYQGRLLFCLLLTLIASYGNTEQLMTSVFGRMSA